MKWFYMGIFIIILAAIALLFFYKPKPPVSALTETQIEGAVNLYRQQHGLAPLTESPRLQTVVDTAIAQIGQTNIRNNPQGVQVRLDTDSTSLLSSYKILEADGLETVADLLNYWSSDSETSAILLSPNFNIMGISAGRSQDGVQYVYGMVAFCKTGC